MGPPPTKQGRKGKEIIDQMQKQLKQWEKPFADQMQKRVNIQNIGGVRTDS